MLFAIHAAPALRFLQQCGRLHAIELVSEQQQSPLADVSVPSHAGHFQCRCYQARAEN